MMSSIRGALMVSCLAVLAALGGIRAAGKYHGVVVFDRWGGCHLYSGIHVMEVSESVKSVLRPYADRAVVIEAKEVLQPIHPGDGLIRQLSVLGRADETKTEGAARALVLDGLELKVFANLRAAGGAELIVELKNNGTSSRSIDTEGLAPTLLAKSLGQECFSPSDGPSYVAVTRTSINALHRHPAAGCHLSGRSRTVRMWLSPGTVVPKTFDLGPGRTLEVPLQFALSEGEYEFLAGYGGGVHESRTLASNRIAFDVDGHGQPHLVGRAARQAAVTRIRRTGAVCGRVTSQEGGAMAKSDVFLWPVPLSKWELRAANHAVTNERGEFRMENVTEGRYVLSGVRMVEGGVLAGALGDGQLTDANSLALPAALGDCSLLLTLRRAPAYTVRGRANPPPEGRTFLAKIVLMKGEPYPFEVSVPVGPDGSYEFRAIPAGQYQFLAGTVGTSFEADRNIENFNTVVDWGVLNRGAFSSGGAGMNSEEAMARADLSQLHEALQSYQSQYRLGFPVSLKELGQPPAWARVDAGHAGLLDDTIAGQEVSADGFSVAGRSYRIGYVPGAANERGRITDYFLSARPIEFGKTGQRSYLADAAGKIHSTREDRAAALSDPVDRP
ncbi:MAG: hypothetical protein QM757_35570 [Paludibaculum sp.]